MMGSVVFQWLVPFLFSALHPFYVSMTEINHNEKEKSLEISVRIFADDLEKTLKPYSKGKVDLLHAADKKAMNELVYQYMQQRLQLLVDDKPVKFVFVGYEPQMESIWTYLEVPNVPSFKKITVNNSLLHDLTKDQINLVQVKARNQRQNFKLDFPQTSTSFFF